MTTSQPTTSSGIYIIRCIPTGKVYVGSALRLKSRWHDHRKALIEGRHHSRLLQRAWRKYGEDAFKFIVVEYCGRDDLIRREQQIMDQHNSSDPAHGFNINCTAGSRLGMRLGPESKAKIRAANLGKTMDQETRDKIALAHKGKPKSESHREFIRGMNRGRIRTAEMNERMSRTKKIKAAMPGVRLKMSRAATKISDGQFLQILTMLSAGKSGSVIAKDVGVSPSLICDIRKGRAHQDRIQQCLEASPELATSFNRYIQETFGGSIHRTTMSYTMGTISDDQLKSILTMLASGDTCEAVAIKLRLSPNVVLQIKSRRSYRQRVQQLIEESPELATALDRQGLSDEVLVQVVQMMAQGMAGNIIAKTIGMSPQTICYIKKSPTYQKRIQAIVDANPVLGEAFSRRTLA